MLKRIGYDRAKYGFDAETCSVLSSLSTSQSHDIAQGVDESFEVQRGVSDAADPLDLIGAGDQGMMFGYAVRRDADPHAHAASTSPSLLWPSAWQQVRKDGTLGYLRPDGKTQVTGALRGRASPVAVEKIVVSTQHDDERRGQAQIRADVVARRARPGASTPQSIPWRRRRDLREPHRALCGGRPHGRHAASPAARSSSTPTAACGRHGGGAF